MPASVAYSSCLSPRPESVLMQALSKRILATIESPRGLGRGRLGDADTATRIQKALPAPPWNLRDSYPGQGDSEDGAQRKATDAGQRPHAGRLQSSGDDTLTAHPALLHFSLRGHMCSFVSAWPADSHVAFSEPSVEHGGYEGNSPLREARMLSGPAAPAPAMEQVVEETTPVRGGNKPVGPTSDAHAINEVAEGIIGKDGEDL